jgi:hypothetical protein
MCNVASGLGGFVSFCEAVIFVFDRDSSRGALIGMAASFGISGFDNSAGGSILLMSTIPNDPETGRKSAPHWLQKRLTSRGIGALH